MADLRFLVEWQPPDEVVGVTHPGLTRTWARLEIRVGDECVTTVIDKRAGGTRAGVYGSVLPLTEWLVRNFWFLLHEAPPLRPFGPAWLRRHSLLQAREGFGLPNLRLFRDEENIGADWQARRSSLLPVDFVSSGRAQLDLAQVRAALTSFVDLVLERLRGSLDPDSEALLADWNATVSARGDEAKLASRAARLGLDAWDEAEVSDSVAALLVDSLDRLPTSSASDLLDSGIFREKLAPTINAVAELTAMDGPVALSGGETTQTFTVPARPEPYQQGYATAQRLRHDLKLSAGGRVDIADLLGRLGWRGLHDKPVAWNHLDPHVRGVVGWSPEEGPRLAAPQMRSDHRRFLVARTVYALLSDATAVGPRLMTSAGTRLQVASRAFAAELLAPAAILRARAVGPDDTEGIDELASELDVAPTVIQKQLENLEADRHSFS